MSVDPTEELSSDEEFSSEDSDERQSDESSSEYYSRMDEKYGRDELISRNDPYDPDPSLSDYLGSTSSALSRDELGLDSEDDSY